jgi:hypothetical protein
MWRFAILLLLPFLALPRPVAAQEFIAVPDLISDEAFYRLVACAAPPGGDCAKPFIRWPTERRLRLRVGIAQISEEFAGYRLDLVDRAVDRAIAEINGAGAHLFLERAFEAPFDVPIYLVDAPQGGEISGTGVADLDGSSISIGRVALGLAVMKSPARPSPFLAISSGARSDPSCWRNWCRPWGLSLMWFLRLTRIRSFPRTTTPPPDLRGQDAAALRRHYPRL